MIKMIDLTRITPDQANRIECALLILERDVREHVEAHYQLANRDDLPASTRSHLKSDGEWWEEVYNLIYGKDERA